MVLMNLAIPDLQVRSRATDIENGLGDTAREGEGGMNQEISIDIYTHDHV